MIFCINLKRLQLRTFKAIKIVYQFQVALLSSRLIEQFSALQVNPSLLPSFTRQSLIEREAKMRLIVVISLIFTLISATFAVVSYTNHRVVKFRIETEEQLLRAIELGDGEGVSS